MKYTLYGDGIHDDTPAIQEMIDSGACEVTLPAPAKQYLITRTLTLPSNFRLSLPRYAEIKLADGANCHMVRSHTVTDFADRLPADINALCRHLWYHVNEYSPDAVAQNIEISGGIWNCNNLHQLPNPEQSKVYEPYGYTGDGMLFYGVRNIRLSNMTIKDPVHYGVTFDRASYFTVEDITFDYNLGNPKPINMDGIHFNGNCHFGMIRNLKGACYDDLVAVNAHEGSSGPISNIEIDGLFAERCHSAVRLLTVTHDVTNIHISNVYGSYYQYCVGLTKYYPGTTTGVYDAISIDHIYASKAPREGIYPWPDSYVYPFIFLQKDIRAKTVRIADVHRRESVIPVETVHVGKNTVVDDLILDTVTTENRTGTPMPLLANSGTIGCLTVRHIRANGDPELVGEGTIQNKIQA